MNLLKMALEDYIRTFEEITGKRFKNKPRMQRLSRVALIKIILRESSKFRLKLSREIYGNIKGPIYSRLSSFGNILLVLCMEPPAAFYYPKTHTIFQPKIDKKTPKYWDCLWHEMTHAWSHDAQKQPEVEFDPYEIDEERIVRTAFEEGLAQFTSDEMLTQTGMDIPPRDDVYQEDFWHKVGRELSISLMYSRELNLQIRYRTDPNFVPPPDYESILKHNWEQERGKKIPFKEKKKYLTQILYHYERIN